MKPIDLQINGYAGVDFNRACSVEEIHGACELLVEDGVDGILATVITADIPLMVERIAAIAKACEESELVRRVVAGIHIEGPFISPQPGYVGAHNAKFVTPATVEAAKPLIDAGQGLVRLVTLAPEQDQEHQTTRWLSGQGIVVSAGHCNPTIARLEGAVESGLSMFTHLGNGCPMQQHRHDNIVQRVLRLADRIWCCFIADGAHIDFFALKNYIRCAGVDRSIIVTDAISAARLGAGSFTLGEWKIEIGSDLIARAPGGDHFVGSTMTMPRSIDNLKSLGFTAAEIELMTSINPRKALDLPLLESRVRRL